MAKVTRLMADLPEDDDGPPVVEEIFPNLMARVRLEHEMEGLRRDRDKRQKHLDTLVKLSETRGRMLSRSMMIVQQKQINDLTDKIEVVIQNILELDDQE